MKVGTKCWRYTMAVVGVVLSLMLPTTITFAQGFDPNSDVFPPNSIPFGMTYEDWSAVWWQYVFSIPKHDNPLLDPTGKDCAVGQSGPVWYLVGTFTTNPAGPNTVIGIATRSCTIPADRGILFPIINAECSTVEGNGTTEAELRACAVDLVNHTTTLEATVDGVKLHSLNPPNSPFRVQSPLFKFTLPPSNILGISNPNPNPSPSVSDGYYILLGPLPVGQHTIHFSGSVVFTQAADRFDFTFQEDITYHLTIAP